MQNHEIEWQVTASLVERNSPGPTLRTAMERVRQALARVDELQALQARMNDLSESKPLSFIIPRSDLEMGDFSRVRFEDGDATFSASLLPEARLLASEVIHHLRTALEYLAHQLVWLDTGAPFKNSAFPMCHKSRDWPKALRYYLPGLFEGHAHAVKKMQPFRHCRWVMQLQESSNTDKHRNVLDVRQLLQGDVVRLSPEEGRPYPGRPDLWILEPAGQRMSLELADGTDAIETTVRLCAEAAKAITSFQRDFGESMAISVTLDGKPAA